MNALKADEAEALSPDERKMRSTYGLPQKALTDPLRYDGPKYYDMALR